jgi:metallo-beta-lactamase family protein
MQIDFLGAAQGVTGSMHLLTVNGSRILLECGLFQGHRDEAFDRNRNLPFDKG